MPKSGIRIFHYVTNKISSSSEKDTTPQQAKLYVVRKLGKVAKKRSLDTNFPLFGGAKLTISKGPWHATYCAVRDTQSRQFGGSGGKSRWNEKLNASMPLLPIIIRRCANYFDSPFGYNGSNSTAN